MVKFVKSQRRHFLIDISLQPRHRLSICLPLFVVCLVCFFCLSMGIWTNVLSSFIDQKIPEDLLTVKNSAPYEEVMENAPPNELLSFFRSVQKMSLRLREVFGDSLNQTTRSMTVKFIFLFFLLPGKPFISRIKSQELSIK